MPYNNSAIAPNEEITGAATLPLARVKKILAVDEEIGAVSANASFAITIATEMFIRYFADQAMNVVKSEKKPRRNIQYRDLANAVSRIDNLSFLEDIVPRTTTLREYRSRAAQPKAPANAPPLQNGQTTLDGSSRRIAQRPPPPEQAFIPLQHPEESFLHPHPPMAIGQMEGQQLNVAPPMDPSQSIQYNPQQYVFEHYEPNGNPRPVPLRRDEAGDIEMGQ
ncbi:uncharacterized protein KY384_007750 [Bacidia gigantensis]|uniref:uncharacterized protein n=1 Tax=Bacidia gigantensis TaxID=2732470 RepID=UPI001D04D16D|nr:uncharacterized protein KY384_007750 [Bacidia gigantensis]KAG8527597.1 hypothetical protein KY384_007750 [Bacidia gigantensis]